MAWLFIGPKVMCHRVVFGASFACSASILSAVVYHPGPGASSLWASYWGIPACACVYTVYVSFYDVLETVKVFFKIFHSNILQLAKQSHSKWFNFLLAERKSVDARCSAALQTAGFQTNSSNLACLDVIWCHSKHVIIPLFWSTPPSNQLHSIFIVNSP